MKLSLGAMLLYAVATIFASRRAVETLTPAEVRSGLAER
jgi:hypothetical protein